MFPGREVDSVDSVDSENGTIVPFSSVEVADVEYSGCSEFCFSSRLVSLGAAEAAEGKSDSKSGISVWEREMQP